MSKNPYEWLYETTSQPLKGYVLDEVARHLAAAVESFPPVIENWEREDLRARFEPLLARAGGRPKSAVVRTALRLFRWEMERDFEAIDRYMAGGHWQERGLGADELETAVFLWRYWTDETLAFKEYAQGKFRWSELVALADRLESRLLQTGDGLRL